MALIRGRGDGRGVLAGTARGAVSGQRSGRRAQPEKRAAEKYEALAPIKTQTEKRRKREGAGQLVCRRIGSQAEIGRSFQSFREATDAALAMAAADGIAGYAGSRRNPQALGVRRKKRGKISGRDGLRTQLFWGPLRGGRRGPDGSHVLRHALTSKKARDQATIVAVGEGGQRRSRRGCAGRRNARRPLRTQALGGSSRRWTGSNPQAALDCCKPRG